MDAPNALGGLPMVSARGTPRALGEALGNAFHDSLASLTSLIAERLRRITVRGRALDRSAMIALLAPISESINRFEPSLWMELEGMSLGSGLPVEALLMIHGYADLLSYLECRTPPQASTFIGLGGSQTHGGMPLMAHAWAPEPFLQSHLAVVRRKPTNAPATLALTIAGLHPLAGVSQAQLAVSWNELRVSDGHPGLMSAHLVAQALVAPDYATAARRFEYSPRFGGGAVHLLSGNGQRCSLEISGSTTAKLGDPDATMLRIHTNHPIADEITPHIPIVEDTSRSRLGRVARLAVENRAVTPRAIASWFGIEPPNSANQDPDELLPQGIPEAFVVTVLDPRGGRLWVHTDQGDGEARL